jgi:hypothetical protein
VAPNQQETIKYEDNNKMDLGQISWGGAKWIGLAQDSDKWRAELSYSIKFWETIKLLNSWWPL